MTTECPNCGNENAYYDGVRFVCPDCDCEWEADFFFEEDDDSE